jgi:membrane-associated protein
MPPTRFFAANIPAILLWAPAHVLPGVLAISVLHRYGGFPHHSGLRHYWMLTVIVGALVIWLAIWTIRRLRGGAIKPAAEQVQD